VKKIKRIVEQVTAAFDRLTSTMLVPGCCKAPNSSATRFSFGFPANRISEVRAIIDPSTPESPAR